MLDTVRAAVAARVDLAVDEREHASAIAILRGLDELPRPFDEHAQATHVTGSAIVVGARGTVLHRHKRLGLWLQPGGHIDAGETPWDAAVREAREETGLPVAHVAGGPRLVHVDVHLGGRGHTHFDLRYLLVTEDDGAEPAPAEGESADVRWFGWDDAVAIADDGLRSALVALRP